MRIVISGGTGFIGQALTQHLTTLGHHVTILTRSAIDNDNKNNVRYVQWLTPYAKPEKEIGHADAFVNLAGKTINARWTQKNKKAIFNSRKKATKEMIRIMKAMDTPPYTLINASAIGFYGTSQSRVFTESSGYSGGDFLSEVVRHWEKAASEAESLGVRVVYARFGIVLGMNGGAFPKMILPYRLFAGGTVGSGQQWVSWVHIEDLVKMLTFAIENPKIFGPINVTAPNPVTMKNFGKTIGTVMKRSHWLPVPEFALKTMLGEMSMLLVEGQKAMPDKALQEGYTFKYPLLKEALTDLL